MTVLPMGTVENRHMPLSALLTETNRGGLLVSRTPDRRQTLQALLMGSSALASGLIAGCAAGEQTGVSTTGSIAPESTSAPQPGPAPRGDRAKIALLLPLSGGPQTAAVALALKQAAEMAVIESKAAAAELVVRDDKGTEAGAKTAAEEAIKAGTGIIIGPLFSRSVKAAAPVARAANVPLISLSNDPDVAGPGIYMFGASQKSEVARAIAYAAAHGRRRFAALLPDDGEGRILEPLFKAAVSKAGGAVVTIEKYKLESNGLVDLPRARREALKRQGFDALFLPAGQDTLPQLASMLHQSGLAGGDVRVVGTSGWEMPHAVRQVRLEGAWFAAPDPKGWHDFAERFGRAHNAMPPRLATLAYDAVLMATALAPASKASRFSASDLTRAQGFTGADGAFRFTASGEVERGLAVLELHKTGIVIADPPLLPRAGAQAHAFGASPRFN